MTRESSPGPLEGWSGQRPQAPARRDREIASVANAMRLIDSLEGLGEAGVSELARKLDLSKPAVDRLLSTLMSTGFVEQNYETRQYRLTIKFIAIANSIRPRAALIDIARPHMVELAESFHETVNLGILSNGTVVYAESIFSRQMFRIEAKPGTMLPAYCTALGQAILAYSPEDMLDQYMSEFVPVAYTKYTTTNAAELRRHLSEVRDRGYAIDLGQILEEVCCLAAPICDSKGEAIAAISVTAPRSVFTTKRPELENHVPQVAAQITKAAIAVGAQPPAVKS